MGYDEFNYNNDHFLHLNLDDLKKRRELIEYIYQYFEELNGEISFQNNIPVLLINGYEIAKIKNHDIDLTNKYLTRLNISDGQVVAYINYIEENEL
ncbi:hypothetical protein [Staphylococcus kloosii]|uniref:Uncharacterized protein n=1 Tax=Staphylococcus kloosii TaxID=29384 RepID=A0ABQ0XIB8_9STAP|nr:hypothetical protein [Staphylococcus kloosii]AVQ35014.1 hypothetical protein C7J89_02275 [Staphylococcus kloosii]PNZ01583.1 hypothetical protein CD136_13155 [Staphylococcus kloosii]GEP81195.1 hypothetical protein SKL01_03730 [Staphylococcus kloosii]SUM48048.1 Uncharacterised protein [Staphylococcus kloosii]